MVFLCLCPQSPHGSLFIVCSCPLSLGHSDNVKLPTRGHDDDGESRTQRRDSQSLESIAQNVDDHYFGSWVECYESSRAHKWTKWPESIRALNWTVDRRVSPTPSGISDWLTGLSTWWSQLERCLGKRCSTRASSAVFNSRSVVPCPVHSLTAQYAMNYNIIVLENWTLKMDRQIVYESDCIWGGRSDFKWTGTEMERDRDRRIGRDDFLNRINKNIYV